MLGLHEQRLFEMQRLVGVARNQAFDCVVLRVREAFMSYLACVLLQIKDMQSLVRVGGGWE